VNERSMKEVERFKKEKGKVKQRLMKDQNRASKR